MLIHKNRLYRHKKTGWIGRLRDRTGPYQEPALVLLEWKHTGSCTWVGIEEIELKNVKG